MNSLETKFLGKRATFHTTDGKQTCAIVSEISVTLDGVPIFVQLKAPDCTIPWAAICKITQHPTTERTTT